MKYVIPSTAGICIRFVLSLALTWFGTRTAWAQISPPPPCEGTMTLTMNVAYQGCNNPNAYASVIVNCVHPPIQYAWSNGSSSNIIVNVPPGTYSVTVTDSTGTSLVGSVTVAPPPATPPSFTATATNAPCGSSNGAITFSATGGLPPYHYRYRRNGTTTFKNVNNVGAVHTVQNIAPGTYTVILTDTHLCRDTLEVTVGSGLTATATTQSNATCFGAANGQISVNATGGTGPYTVAWSGAASGTQSGQTLPKTFGNLPAGAYTFTVTDANGCSGTATASVSQPPVIGVTVNGGPLPCGGQTTLSAQITGGTAPYALQWSTAGNPTTPTVTVTQAGAYTVTVTDANGCTATGTTTVAAAGLLVSIKTTNVSCPGQQNGSVQALVLSGGQPPFQYQWNTGQTGAIVSNLGPGTYSVTITDATGCTGTATTQLTEPPVLVLTATPVGANACAGAADSVILSATGGTPPYQFLWNGQPSGPVITNVGPGTYTAAVVDSNQCMVSTTLTLGAANALTATITVTDLLCPGDNTVSLQAAATGGTAPYSYAWSNGTMGTATLTNVPPGAYTVTVTAANGCTATATVNTGPAPAPIVITATPSAPSCQGFVPTVQLSASGGTAPYTFLWQNATVTPPLTNVAPGTYTIQITDANGCTATTTTTITVPPAFEGVTFTTVDVACFGQSTGSITAVVNSAYSPVTYQWSPGNATGAVLQNVPAGTYTVTVTVQNNPNCTFIDTITIAQPASPLAVTISTTNPLCPGDSVFVITATASGGKAPYTYAWSNGAATPTLTNPGAGTYTVTVTDAAGCTATATQVVGTVPQPLVLTATPSAPSCEGFVPTVGLSATGGTAPYTFSWQNNPVTPPVTNVAAGTYTAMVTDANGCTATTAVPITVSPAFDTVTYNVTNVACFGQSTGSVTATVVSPYTPVTYQWNTGATGPTLTNLTAGTYILTITVQNNTDCQVVDTITVGQPAAALNVTIVASNLLCSGDSLTLQAQVTGGTAPYTYAWSNGATTPVLVNPTPGSYVLTVTDANGCTATATQVVATGTGLLAVTATPSAPSCQGFVPTVTLAATGGTAPYTFQWQGDTVVSPVANVPPGVYTVQVTDANGCTATTTVTITVPPVVDSLDFTITNVFCFGQTTGSAVPVVSSQYSPVTFQWSNGQPTLTNVGAGTYFVTITVQNDSNCTVVDTVTISQPPVLAVEITMGTMFCPGDSMVDLVATVTGGTPPYTYAWNTGGTGSTLTGVAPNTQVIVSVTDANGCTAADTVTTGPAPAPIVITVTPSAPSCEGFIPTVTLGATGGTAPYTFQWADSTITSPPTNVPGGIYVVTVTDANGCTATTTVTLTVPPVIDSVSYVITGPNCFGDSTGSVVPTFYSNYTPITWTWSNGDTDSLTNVGGGTYVVTVTVGGNVNCTFIDTVTVPQPPAIIPAISITDTLCTTNVALTLTASATGGTAPYTFIWQDSTTQPVLVNVPAGVYSVTVTDANGCTGVTTDTLAPIQQLDVQIVLLSPSCAGSANGAITVQGLGGTPPYGYTWAHDSTLTSGAVTGLAPGAYTVTVTDANNCQADTTIQVGTIDSLDVTLIITPAPCPGVPGSSVTAVVDSTSGTGPFTFTWQPAGASNSAVLDSLPGGTVVSVTVTAANGCTGTATGTVGTASALSVTVQATHLPCAGPGLGSVTATVMQGTAPFTFDWTVPGNVVLNDTTAQLTDVAVGTYTVTVTDATGCTTTATTEVLPGIQPVAAFTPSTTCLDTSSSIQFIDQSTGAASWSWQITINGDSVLTLTGQAPPATVFQEGDTLDVVLTVTSPTGCTDTATAVIPVFGLPMFALSAGDTTVLCSDTLPIPITVTGANGYAYTWSPTTGLTFAADSISVFALPDSTTQYVLTVQNGNCILGDTVLVVVPPDMNLQVDSNLVCGDTVANVVATTAVPAIFQWYLNGVLIDSTFNDTISTITVPVGVDSLAGPYTVVATDGFYGCTRSWVFTVADVAFALDSLVAPPPACAGDSVLLSVVSSDTSATFSWYSVPGGVVFSDSTGASTLATGPAGTFTVFVAATNGVCTALDSVTVVFTNGQPVAPFTADTCNGLRVQFTNPVGLTGTWTFGDNSPATAAVNPEHEFAAPGNYQVTFTPDSSGCLAPVTLTVPVKEQPSVVVHITANLEDCLNAALVQFNDASVLAGTLLTRLWVFTNGETQTSTAPNPLITFTEEGMVMATLTVTDVNGCVGSDTMELPINIIVEEINDTMLYCQSGPVALNPVFNADYLYSWFATPDDPTLVGTTPNPLVEPQQPTTYYVQIRNGVCEVRDSAQVLIEDAANLVAPSDTAACTAAPLTLSVQSANAAGFEWSLSPSFDTIFATTAAVTVPPLAGGGPYYVRATTAAGCTAIDSIRVEEAGLLVVPPAARKVCLGETIELAVDAENNGGALTYVWSPTLPNVPNPEVTPTAATTYAVTVTNAEGCSAQASFAVDVLAAAVTAEIDGKDTICPGEFTTLVATPGGTGTNFSYQWTPAGSLSDPNEPVTEARPTETTTYIVRLLADDLCPAFDTVTVHFRDFTCADPYVFVPKAFTPNADQNNDVLYVRGASIVEMYFVVWDRWGEKVFETTDKNIGWDGTFNGVASTPDAYAWYLRVTCGEEWVEMKGNVTLIK